MAFIPVYKSVSGKCYQHEDGTYLGEFKERGNGTMREEGPGAGTYRPIYVFANKTLGDNYPSDKVKEVPCETGGKRRTRKHKRKHKKTQKRRR
jgi:hypothetical protein